MNGDIGIGKLITEERGRDAIHVAVAPVTAACVLEVGTHVSIDSDGKACLGSHPIGIVDPFLKRSVKTGERFYLFLYPGSITSLRHEWIHPAFGEVQATPAPPADQKAVSEAWLREYAKKVNPYYAEGGYYYEKTGRDTSYEMLMEDLRGITITYHGIDMHSRSELIDEEELRHHASIVLGRPVNFDYFEYFSCSC